MPLNKFISLKNSINQHIVSLDTETGVLRVEREGSSKECRLQPVHVDILYTLFSQHPITLTYEQITDRLKSHHLMMTDVTRMHRKISQLRKILKNFDEGLEHLMINTRGVGYSLTLDLRPLYAEEGSDQIAFNNPLIAAHIEQLKWMITQTLDRVLKMTVIPHSQGWILDRASLSAELASTIANFSLCANGIMQQLRMHEADFEALRVEYILVKLKTYVGLARISVYPISELQWQDWFKHEVWALFDELNKLIKIAQ